MYQKFIPYGRQDISNEDVDAVLQVLNSDYLTQGPVLEKFEEKISQLTTAEQVVAVNSATSALHIACLALGVQKDDLVWTVPNTFVASANCALYCGARIDFVDIDLQTYNMSIFKLREKLESARRAGDLPKVVIPVHLAGEPCDMASIKDLSNEFGFKIIEDASHAIGGTYKNNPIGSCKFSDITVFSFHPVKIVTSGEGGAALTNCKNLADKLRLLRSHGITRDPKMMQSSSDNAWYYEQIALGFNYRMTDIHAALGLSQLSRLHEYVNKRHQIGFEYDNELAELPLQIPIRNATNRSSLHLYVIQVDEDVHGKLFNYLRNKNIGINLHYIPVHTQPFYQRLGFKWGDFPNAEKYYQRAISLPIYPTLFEEQLKYIVKSVKSFYRG